MNRRCQTWIRVRREHKPYLRTFPIGSDELLFRSFCIRTDTWDGSVHLEWFYCVQDGSRCIAYNCRFWNAKLLHLFQICVGDILWFLTFVRESIPRIFRILACMYLACLMYIRGVSVILIPLLTSLKYKGGLINNQPISVARSKMFAYECAERARRHSYVSQTSAFSIICSFYRARKWRCWKLSNVE